MTTLGFHSTTSMAVKSVIQEIRNKLSTRFDFLEGFPDLYYDFDKGLSEQFKQYYAKIPASMRQEPWICLAYSYDSSQRSSVQPRRGFKLRRPVADNLKRDIAVVYNDLPLLCSIMTNDSKLLNALSSFIQIHLDWSITCKYQDLLWPTWVASQAYPLGWYIRPSEPNGRLYKCLNPDGVSGETEPDWQDIVGSTQLDGTVQWLCIEPDLLSVRAADFVKNDTVIQNPIEQGIMYQYDFGYTLHYTDFDDVGGLTGVITEAALTLLNWYNEGAFSEVVKAPD